MAASTYLKLLVMTAALVAGVLTLVLAKEPAEAAFPGTNGKLAFDSVLPGQADSEILTLSYNPNGGPVPEDPDPQLTANTAQDSGAAWSPDGSKIAFERASDLWVMNSNGTRQLQLTTLADIDSNPTWSPDGSKLAFVSNSDGDLDIWTLKPVPEGPTNVRQNLTDDSGSGAFDSDPAFSPYLSDGSTRIAFHRNGDVWTVDPDNPASKIQITTEPTGSDSFPNWSPKGTRIAFQSNRNTAAFPNGIDQEIYTIKAQPENATTNEPRRLTDNTARDEAPAYSPEGSHIAFMSNRRDSNLEIWVMSTLSDDIAVRLTNNRGIDEYPDWQPVPTCTKRGTNGNDKVVGTTGKDILCGGAGNDTLIGRGGNDILLGESGNDSMQGGTTGNDIHNGGTGIDTASYASSATAVNASLATDFATGEGSDLISFIERLTGSTKADTLTVANTDTSTTPSFNAANVLKGLGGADTLDAAEGTGNDRVDGGTGTDVCQTDAGDTKLNCP